MDTLATSSLRDPRLAALMAECRRISGRYRFGVLASRWHRVPAAGGLARWLRELVLGAVSLLALLISNHAQAAAPAPAECAALQAKYPQFKGKTLINAINPHTPGYEALDPNDPSKYIGF